VGGGGGVNFGPHIFEGFRLERGGVFLTEAEVDDGERRGFSGRPERVLRRIPCGCGPTKGKID
jgi:hypothetical protein